MNTIAIYSIEISAINLAEMTQILFALLSTCMEINGDEERIGDIQALCISFMKRFPGSAIPESRLMEVAIKSFEKDCRYLAGRLPRLLMAAMRKLVRLLDLCM